MKSNTPYVAVVSTLTISMVLAISALATATIQTYIPSVRKAQPDTHQLLVLNQLQEATNGSTDSVIRITPSAPASPASGNPRPAGFVGTPVTNIPSPLLRNPRLAKYEPESGCYLGAFIDLDPNQGKTFLCQNGHTRKLPDEFEKKTGKEHAMYFFYLGYGRPLPMDWVLRLHELDKYVHVALEPNDGLDKVKDDQYLRDLADEMHKSGARIFLRFASEMNGNWVAWNGNPRQYIEKWRLVTRVMRERAPNVAMVWCPYTFPRGNIDSYYPGDEWVDWVGVNMYSVTYFNQNKRTPAKDIVASSMLDAVYQRYSARKPIFICEYGVTSYSALEDKEIPDFAIEKLSELFRSIRTKYPRVKAINYFSANALLLTHRRNNDYTLTGNQRVLQTYRDLIQDDFWIGSPTWPTILK
ncbi:MAG: hypothetical protein MUC92_06565 [Fimbriimonadaceae bacterium]|nr:hypothetical protein [Fimbriimonadaceae bacterium]